MWALERHRQAESCRVNAIEQSLARFRDSVFTIDDVERLDAFVDVQLGQQRAPQHVAGDYLRSYVRAANITSSGLDLSDVKQMNFEPKEWEKFRLQHGDVLVTEGCGSIKELGNSAVWSDPDDSSEMFFQKTLLRLRPRGDGATPSLVREWARWAQESGLFARVANGTGILHITAVRCSSLPFPRLTPLEVQRRSDQFDSLRQSRDAVDASLRSLASLRSSILADIFGGAV
jgi:type I restriction enzyme S subunit